MKIINPIYDQAFKYLMDNEKLAKKILSIILEQEVIAIQSKPQEVKTIDKKNDIPLSRFDFKAVIRNPENQIKNVLIEIQKSKYPIKNEFVELLTHPSYILQIARLKPERKTKLEKFLSLFDQKKKTDDDYVLDISDEDLEDLDEIVEYLNRATQDEEMILKLELEEDMEESFEKLEKELAEERKEKEEAKAREEEAKAREVEAKAREIEAKAREIEAKAREVEAKAREVEANNVLATAIINLQKTNMTVEQIAAIMNLPVEKIKQIIEKE